MIMIAARNYFDAPLHERSIDRTEE